MISASEQSRAKRKGSAGEELARRYLEQIGFRIVETNYRFGRGEIDIIAMDGEVLVFCEVKTRERDDFGPPEYAITPRKRQQIRKVASGYLFDHDIAEQACRFDVVTILMREKPPLINYIRNAF